MESTESSWKPIGNILEGKVQLLLANSQHIKAVPGRKTDVRDAEWIAELCRHGRLPASYVPDREQRELRELVRYRHSLIEEHSSRRELIPKVLEGANINLSSVVRTILGATRRDILEHLAQWLADPRTCPNSLGAGSRARRRNSRRPWWG